MRFVSCIGCARGEGVSRSRPRGVMRHASFTNASATGWYLFTAPQSVPFVVAFLNGVQAPTVESFGFDTDPSTLSYRWRVYHDFGCAFGQKQASVFMKGTT